MDSKVTLSFDQSVVQQAKKFAQANNISLSRLTEYLLRKATEPAYKTLEDMPVSDWVAMVAEGVPEYVTKPKSKKDLKTEFLLSKDRK